MSEKLSVSYVLEQVGDKTIVRYVGGFRQGRKVTGKDDGGKNIVEYDEEFALAVNVEFLGVVRPGNITESKWAQIMFHVAGSVILQHRGLWNKNVDSIRDRGPENPLRLVFDETRHAMWSPNRTKQPRDPVQAAKAAAAKMTPEQLAAFIAELQGK